MTTAFKTDDLGPYVEADPNSDLDYSITCWLEGVSFESLNWIISPEVPGVPYNPQINAAPVEIDGVSYSAGKVASCWIKGLQEGLEYLVTLQATFTGGRKDDRSFRVKCLQK